MYCSNIQWNPHIRFLWKTMDWNIKLRKILNGGNTLKLLTWDYWNWGSQDSSVGTATSYGLDGRDLIPGNGKRFSLLHSAQTSSGAHPAPIQWIPRDDPWGLNGWGMKLATHLSLGPRSRTVELYLHSPTLFRTLMCSAVSPLFWVFQLSIRFYYINFTMLWGAKG
jgi:hypothetical protein